MYRITVELVDGGEIVMDSERIDFDVDGKTWRFPNVNGDITVSRNSVASVDARRKEGA